MQIIAQQALLPEGWAEGVAITVQDGLIASVAPAGPGAAANAGTVVPGMANLHSHAFQRGFAGLTEQRGAARDSFWTWREMMYRFALQLDPDGAQAIAEMAYVEMLEAGFTRVGEFHYLHHAPDGRPFDDRAEMSARIFAAADATGLSLTHLPVFYARGGFGPQPATEGQRRFLNGVDGFVDLVRRCDAMATRPGDVVGYAPHSLRAASKGDLMALTAALTDRKVHIHIAEQVKEVEDCLAFSGSRPVDWLFDHMEVTPDWCLIHATHLSEDEVTRMAKSGAVAGLCPVTEANLGDGIFAGRDFLSAGGRFGIGTDSNVQIGLAGELQALEYSQRLSLRERNVLTPVPGSTGEQLFTAALAGGAQALGAPEPVIAVGAPADLVALEDPFDLGTGGAQTLDRWIFGRDIRVRDVWVRGAHLVQDGRHRARDAIAQRYGQVVRAVLAQ
ncbi:formimidoylglutamate deiminase [Puniceibacterium sediminis]|uniref:Formimidoylglutamate deiminase n=1 Tax=Puniceibacterium sediminis TaxID=1608407 RepID=A0A238YXK0_9RHOB|nr:formimidoylglutamate deiminase [Puniceibacterium sediminis]SNR75702.1 formimidoylglutamate deiminase [Puniceibacterium sediminis]